jgi:hypothetical protein
LHTPRTEPVPSLPNLIIVGAAKCGTTSLHHYLSLHPEISMSATKELNFFVRADWRERRAWYESHFDARARIRGEASVTYTWYPFRPCIAERIREFTPEAKIIYMVRDPFERTVAHWVEHYSFGDRVPFEVRLLDWRRPDNLFVCASRYATQLERYRAHFSTSQILVVDQQELRTDRRRVLGEVFSFLGVDDAFWTPAFEVERNTRRQKYAPTRVGYPIWNHALGPAVRPLPPRVRDPLRRVLIRSLSRKIQSPTIDPIRRRELTPLYRDEADRLRAMTGKALSQWSV